MKCTELVVRDHAILRRGLHILDGLIRKLEGGERIEIADVNAVLKFFKVFGEEYHQAVEENALYPALMSAAGPGSSIHQMAAEHGEERSLVAWMTDAMTSRRIADFAYTSRRLIVILRDHLEREDSALGQLASQLLAPEADALITAEFTKCFREPDSLLNFQRLERKYLPKGEPAVEQRPEVVRRLEILPPPPALRY
jgi:hemerythrin-like domain-containing protein